MKTKQNSGVFAAIRSAAAARPLLTAGTLLCVAASVGASLLPPLLLGRVIDRLTGGMPLSALAVLFYFGSLARLVFSPARRRVCSCCSARR